MSSPTSLARPIAPRTNRLRHDGESAQVHRHATVEWTARWSWPFSAPPTATSATTGSGGSNKKSIGGPRAHHGHV